MSRQTQSALITCILLLQLLCAAAASARRLPEPKPERASEGSYSTWGNNCQRDAAAARVSNWGGSTNHWLPRHTAHRIYYVNITRQRESPTAHQTRTLKQAFPGCPAGCAPNACNLADTSADRHKCTICLGNLLVNPLTGTCECPVGAYAASSSCADCPKGSYCPGGTYTGNGGPAASSCPGNMSTVGRRASSIWSCVNLPGFAYALDSSGTPTAVPCPADSYCPGFRKQPHCYLCPTGYTTAGAITQSKRRACLVAQGMYLKAPGEVAICPKGTFKSGYDSDTWCTPCAPGVTTPDVGAVSNASCSNLLPSFYAVSMDGSIIASTVQCPQGFFCPGGLATAAFNPVNPGDLAGTAVQECPAGTLTVGLGATMAYECMTPPGYKTAGTTTTECVDGENRLAWRPPAVAAACTACGQYVSSRQTVSLTLYEPATGAPTNTLVRGSPSSCYIKPGQGMYCNPASGTCHATNCDSNNYGRASEVHGLSTTPCRDCPYGTHTDLSPPTAPSAAWYVVDTNGLGGFTNISACVQLPGFEEGSGEVALPCPIGSYSPGGAHADCSNCSVGYTTVGQGSASAADCSVCIPGYGGVLNNITSCSECPVGSYSPGGTLGSTNCTSCPVGSTTIGQASQSAAECSVCVPGFGGDQSINATNCVQCLLGSFSAGGNMNSTTCTRCGSGYTTAGKGSQSAENCTVCVPGFGGVGGNGASCSECMVGFYSTGGALGLTNCTSCPEGYTTLSNRSTTSLQCTDNNGCNGTTSPCLGIAHSNGTCYDIPAPLEGYTCQCDEPDYKWNGVICALVWNGDIPCGNGKRGSGVCPTGAGCCTMTGYCQTTPCEQTPAQYTSFVDPIMAGRNITFVLPAHLDASQSSIFFSSIWLDAPRAIDGSYDTFMWTSTEARPWLVLDLQSVYYIAGVRIVNRLDLWWLNSPDFRLWEVRVGSRAPHNNNNIDGMTFCVADNDGTRPHAIVYHLMCNQILLGRYIAIRHTSTDALSLAEVMPMTILV